ncbi:bifunctional diaminohydroxyphosphoribosylaminopyrimidine deaminase/5-amino-6-(5-phosphoribosylamino)uracil reductase RibD [Spirulina major CS-329]|uniref:bifunctional diaminohydroxyphosphoribosylaminopyrimidine deaminase/5-amino-6-(5-phosphoribosylamino)uracil reductase RibD n=1 Tax=Spirulina TaxID=1154 RepID=UPI00232F742E|nr:MULTISPECIES: bifunctional diaminohydroxyphosphoribosylaminopyrimidine deaminase/5-amino-6-(5-phosphoribosylamino)uracil reductase RibD [Spirulina]MDB9496800.1 bifunctional diaminohydroxyphosphoribosylaminopyrimidine deaminase/5-amino-6-(5-phosphoribosylamino)uracil reductase RibD [Spirulina subsalsa CS-330]MDB9501544.1 bifunctional diaminohydroxyphosphoribosylaminopyrimidine deaminase/5-amino-6-(5-phosphoribosylamino)uracil reductase RibD [Spirulina major CS-329]
MADHAFFMQRCLELARQAAGYTAPNPLVGSVVVKDGAIAGEGYHPKAGEPHAEVFALRAAGEAAQGATVYVNLEPCNHTGRTPPCTKALIRAGVKTVVVGMVDPDPRVAGRGMARLRAAGIEVITGVEEGACLALNEGFIQRVTTGRPLGILKYAMTLDGKIATTTGHSAWVSGPESRRVVHGVRALCDGVIVGGNTVRRDNPQLTSHGVSDRNPVRIVLSRRLELPAEAQLWEVAPAPTVIFTTEGANPVLQRKLRDRGVEILEQPHLTIEAVMKTLGDRGMNQVLWECGGVLAAAALQAGAVQKVMAFIAPKIIGGQGAPSPVGELGLQQMTDAIALHRTTLTPIADDWLLSGYLSP